MIRLLGVRDGRCIISEPSVAELRLSDEVAWIDLHAPSPEEERGVESLLGIDVPTREEMQEIETSSRLYRDREATFMTATLIANAESPEPVSSAVTFVLTPRVLVTVRDQEPLPFRTVTAQAQRTPEILAGPETVLVNLLEAIVDRVADILEWIARELETLSREVFAPGTKGKDFAEHLTRLGKNGDVLSRAGESLVFLSRLTAFALQTPQTRRHEAARETLAVIADDITSLNEHVSFLSNKTAFLLDATLGMVNIEQNTIIKLFSMVAVVFLPPTLIASVYGMNFRHMPELGWALGYPLAIAAIVAVMVGSFLFFKLKGWF